MLYVTSGADKLKTKLEGVLSHCFVLVACSKQKKTAVKYEM
jgi:hypothetical protein